MNRESPLFEKAVILSLEATALVWDRKDLRIFSLALHCGITGILLEEQHLHLHGSLNWDQKG